MKTCKIISLFMCIVLLFSFCGCKANQNSEILTEYDLIGQDGCFLYNIISSSDNSNIEGADREANNLKKQLAEAFDIKVNSSSDKKVKSDSKNFEILLGNTNREESKKAYELLKENRVQNIDDWMIKVIDNKICIVAIDDENLAKAIRYFNVNYCTKLSDFSKVTKDFQYIDVKSFEVVNGDKVNIAGNKIGDYTIITTREKSLLYTLKISNFVKIFEEKYGIKIKEGRDIDTNESKYEIVVGNTNRSINESFNLQSDNYVIAVVDNKLIINGGSDAAIAYAFQRLLDLELEARKSNKAFEIPKDFKEEGKVKDNNNEYYMSWSDEFNGYFNKSVWTDPVGGLSSNASPNGGTTYNRGTQNVSVKNGNLVLPSRRLNDIDFENSSVQTTESLAYRYGVLEVRMKLAPAPMCSTIWGSRPSFQIKNGKRDVLSDIKNRMEIDILENYGQKDWFASNIHHWWTDGSEHTSLDGTKYAEQKKYTYPEGEDFFSEYHIFSYEWTPYGFKFAVDGDVYFEYDMSTMGDVGYAQTPIDIRLSAGYSRAGYYLQKKYADDVPKYGEALIDYVRIYQSDKYDNILWYSPVK